MEKLTSFWAAGSGECSLWLADGEFVLQIAEGASIIKSKRFEDPAQAYTSAREWLRAYELTCAVATLRAAVVPAR